MSDRPLPMPTDDTKVYWESAKAGKLVIQQCSSCGARQFYPRPFCIVCLAEPMDWIEASGIGTIYTYTVNHRPANEFMSRRVVKPISRHICACRSAYICCSCGVTSNVAVR